METSYDNAQFTYIAGTADNDTSHINNAFLTTVNFQQGGYDLLTVETSEAATYILGNGVLSLSEGGNNTVALNGVITTLNLGNSHDNTVIVNNTQNGSMTHIYANNLSSQRIYTGDKKCIGTWSGENLNVLTLTVTEPTDNSVQSQIKFYGVSDSNIPQVYGADVYLCDRPQGAISEPEAQPSLWDEADEQPSGAISEPEEPPTLDDIISSEITPPSDGGSESTWPDWIEPIEHGEPSVIVSPGEITDTPKVTPTAEMFNYP